jgi:hypothetical protein
LLAENKALSNAHELMRELHASLRSLYKLGIEVVTGMVETFIPLFRRNFFFVLLAFNIDPVNTSDFSADHIIDLW